MRNRLSSTSIAILALVFPLAALADVSNNQTLSSGQHFSFDTGTAGTSGGDIVFTGTSITFQSTATGFSIGPAGSAEYGILTAATLSAFASQFSQTPISGAGALVANEVFAVKSNGGNYVKVLITSVSSSTLAMTYTAYGVTGSSNVPTITAVLDAGSYTPSIAQGSIFVVKGSGMSAAGFVQTSFPLPTSTSNVSINFTPLSGGAATPAFLIYLYNQSGVNQLAAVLPSTVATGTYNVTVTNSGSTSAPFTATVVKQKPALITADSTGNGLAVMQNYVSASELDVNRFTTGTVFGSKISPAHPGQVEIAYLVGSGADPGPDNQASPGYNFLTNGVTAQVIVGGTTITPSYLGRVGGGSGYEQVNFTLPANITTGCVVPFQLVENGVPSLTTFIAIAPNASASACVQPGYTTAQLQSFDNGATVNVGGFSLSQVTENLTGLGTFSIGQVAGGFTQYSGFELAAIPATAGGTIPTGCQIIQIPGPASTGTGGATGVGVSLDAGKVTLTGPAASNLNNTALTETGNEYNLTISGTGSTVPNGAIVGGTYTLNGAGGTGVGPFKATVTISSPITVTGGLPSVVNRGSGLTLSWTGGGSSDIVVVVGFSETIANGVGTGAEFICYGTAGAQSLNVSSSILNQVPAITAAQIANGTGSGFLEVFSTTNPTNGNGLFSAPLTAGGSISNSTFSSSNGTAGSVVFQ